LHNHALFWRQLADRHPFPKQEEVLDWIDHKVSLFSFSGTSAKLASSSTSDVMDWQDINKL
jgi:hypothetical protein